MPYAIANWSLSKEYRTPRSGENFLEKYIDKQFKDFKECGIDPMFGARTGKNTEAEGYLCIESRGWYSTEGPTCTQWLDFNDPACVAWRKERGLQNLPSP